VILLRGPFGTAIRQTRPGQKRNRPSGARQELLTHCHRRLGSLADAEGISRITAFGDRGLVTALGFPAVPTGC
jgi:hypothetical protein